MGEWNYLSVYLWLYSPFLDLCRFLSLLIIYTVGRVPRTGDKPVARPPPTHGMAQTQNKCTQTLMPQVGFEPTIPVFERAKTVHALYNGATMIDGVDMEVSSQLHAPAAFSLRDKRLP
jgi:hypothetical protein